MLLFIFSLDHKNSAPHKLRDDCALKVEVKVHFSEQQYWLDMRAETEAVLRKVNASLGLVHSSAHGGAGTAESMELTPSEGKKLEKWLDAMSARPVQRHAHAGGHQPTVVAYSAHTLPPPPRHYEGETTPHMQHMQPMAAPVAMQNAFADGASSQAASDLPDLPLFPPSPPLQAFSPQGYAPSINSSMTHSPNDPAYFSLQRPHNVPGRLGFHTPNGLTPHHAISPHTPMVSAGIPGLKRTESAKSIASSFTRPTAEARATLKYMGLREESNRDIFYKSLRSSVDPASQKSSTGAKPRLPRSQQPISATTPTAAPRGSSRAFTAESFFASQSAKPPPALPYESKSSYPTAQNSHRNPEKKVEPELSRERNQRTAPPPLPAQLNRDALPPKIDLSIFKRAHTDVAYQKEVRNDTGNKLMQTAAANKNEKVGFMSGKLRQLKFT